MKFSILALLAAVITITAALLGGLQNIDKNDEMVKRAAREALKQMKSNSNSNDDWNIEVTSANYQVIAGMRFILEVIVTRDNERLNCKIEVIKDLKDKYTINPHAANDDCNKYMKRPSVIQTHRQRSLHVLGGKEELDLTENGVQEAANWAVDHINGMSNSMYRQALQKIADGSKQVVNGYKYRFLLYLVSTTCRNKKENSGKSLDECPAGVKPMREQCDVTVLYSSGEYSMLHSKCKALKVENILGGDDHDYQTHGKVNGLLGGDDHDYQNHEKINTLLGGDNHDYPSPGKVKTLLGGDDHDYQSHGKVKKLLGGDDHDYQNHGKINTLLGGDDRDFQNHGKVKTLLGGDDHDYQTHGKPNLLGQDWHDYIPHLKANLHGLMNTAGKDTKEKALKIGKDIMNNLDAVKKINILGGDTHDYQPHNIGLCEEHQGAFEEFKLKHDRLYASPEEETEKFHIFCGNMERVKEYQKMEQGSAVYGATKFADIAESEFKEKYLGWKMSGNSAKQWPSAEIPKGPIPDSWDWRDHNAVTPVKNQGSCGSCWAFSTTGNIEGKNAIKHKKLVSLSEQELLDCDKIDLACNGGLPTQAYEAIMEIGGIETEKDYTYEAEKEQCKFKKSEVAVKVTGAVNISKDEGDMAAWLSKNGPISIGINAFAMQFYMGGIAHPWKIFCNPSRLDHGVLIVGYGKEGTEPYWIVKNSWGAGWGREGYYYVYRGDGVCGLNTMCTSAIVE